MARLRHESATLAGLVRHYNDLLSEERAARLAAEAELDRERQKTLEFQQALAKKDVSLFNVSPTPACLPCT